MAEKLKVSDFKLTEKEMKLLIEGAKRFLPVSGDTPEPEEETLVEKRKLKD